MWQIQNINHGDNLQWSQIDKAILNEGDADHLTRTYPNLDYQKRNAWKKEDYIIISWFKNSMQQKINETQKFTNFL